jgi:hypothetical protein
VLTHPAITFSKAGKKSTKYFNEELYATNFKISMPFMDAFLQQPGKCNTLLLFFFTGR